MKVLGVDMGKHELKVVTAGSRFSARSKVDETTETEVMSDKTYLLEVNGQRYMIGEGASKEDYDVTKKKLHHKLLMYLGIARYVASYDKVYVVAGCPFSVFLNREKREQFRQYLLDGRVEVKLDGRSVVFDIADIKVVPESVGYLYRNPAAYKHKLVGIIDIGGLNTNAAIYEGLRPIKETAFTLNEGGNILNTKIKHALRRALDVNVQDYEIMHILKNGVYVEGRLCEQGNRVVSEVMLEHIDSIIKETKRHNWNIAGLEIIFTGGGSQLLANHISYYLAHAKVSEGGKWDNAEGFYQMGCVLYGG